MSGAVMFGGVVWNNKPTTTETETKTKRQQRIMLLIF